MALQLIDVTPGAGDTAPAGGAKINANFTELFNIHVVNPRMFRVEMDGDDDTGAVGNGKPFATLAAAMTAAVELSETVDGAEIIIGAGEYDEAANVTTGADRISIIGSSIRNTRISFAVATKLTIANADCYLANLSLLRTGTNAGALLHCTTTSLATYRNLRCDNISVRNDSGTAIGTLSGDANGIEAYGITAIDWVYGGRIKGSCITGHDPTLSAPSYCIKTIQPIAPGLVYGGSPVYDVDEFDIRQFSAVTDSDIINTNPNGVGINGVGENEAGDRVTYDWHHQQTVIGSPDWSNGGQPYVSWYPPIIDGCFFKGPNPLDHTSSGATPLNQGTIVRGDAGTGCMVRGTLRIKNCELYGFYWASYLHDADTQGGTWVAENGRFKLVDNTQSCSWTGTSFISGDTRIGYDDGLRRFQLNTGNTFDSCHFQGEPEFLFEGYQYMCHNCDSIGFRDSEYTSPGQKRAVFGPDCEEPLAIRLDGIGGSYLRTGLVAADVTDAFGLETMTIEAWFRCDDSGGDGRIWSYEEPTITGISLVSVTANVGTGSLYCYLGGQLLCNLTNQGVNDGEWHRVTVTNDAGTGKIYLDGVNITDPTSGVAGCTITGSSGFRIGSDGAQGALFRGDITSVSVSNVVRDHTISRRNVILDANHIAVWPDYTRKSLGWTDLVGNHDLHFTVTASTSVFAAPNLPYWVRRDRSLVWAHATIP